MQFSIAMFCKYTLSQDLAHNLDNKMKSSQVFVKNPLTNALNYIYVFNTVIFT